jgi:hypothetical protein
VMIPAGQASTSFTIRTTRTGITTPVNINASYGGVTKAVIFTVAAPSVPVAISSVAISPQTVVGGSNTGVRFTVTLAGTAGLRDRGRLKLSSMTNLSTIRHTGPLRTKPIRVVITGCAPSGTCYKALKTFSKQGNDEPPGIILPLFFTLFTRNCCFAGESEGEVRMAKIIGRPRIDLELAFTVTEVGRRRSILLWFTTAHMAIFRALRLR